MDYFVNLKVNNTLTSLLDSLYIDVVHNQRAHYSTNYDSRVYKSQLMITLGRSSH